MRIILTIIYTMINFPSSLDSLSNPSAWDYQNTVPHSSQHSNANDAIEALEAKVGIDSSSDPASLDYKVAQLNVLTTKGDMETKKLIEEARKAKSFAEFFMSKLWDKEVNKKNLLKIWISSEQIERNTFSNWISLEDIFYELKSWKLSSYPIK